MSSSLRGEDLARYLGAPPDRSEGRPESHAELMKRVMQHERRLRSLSTLYAFAMADCLGMNLSDVLCLGILSSTGPITPSQLASVIGLSTGSITGLIDRLERLDLVRRERDEEDRRRVVLHLNADRAEEIGKAFIPMLEAGWQHLEQFSDDELRVIARYTEGAVAFMRASTEELRSCTKALFAAGDEPAPEDR